MTAKETLNVIFAYMRYLWKQKAEVSLSCVDKSFIEAFPEIAEYEVHRPTICSYVKSQDGVRSCHLNKKFLRAAKYDKPFYGCCYAGVEEYVFPLAAEGKTLAYVNVSGFCGGSERGKTIRKKRCAADEKYAQFCRTLNACAPSQDEVRAYVAPLLVLLSELFRKIKEEKVEDNSLFGRCLSYVYENYTGEITCEQIAAHMHYSASYLRHLFKRKSGESITDFILRLKLQKAKTLLLSGDLSVTDVAMMSGFNDSNHFSAIFKKYVGISPRAFSKTNGRDEDNGRTATILQGESADILPGDGVSINQKN